MVLECKRKREVTLSCASQNRVSCISIGFHQLTIHVLYWQTKCARLRHEMNITINGVTYSVNNKHELLAPRYRVMRFHQLMGIFTFSELKEWMLKNFPPEYHDDIRRARVATAKSYNRHQPSLDWIAINAEYCSIKRSM